MQEFEVTEFNDVVTKLMSAKDASSFTYELRRLQDVTHTYVSKARISNNYNTGKQEARDRFVSENFDKFVQLVEHFERTSGYVLKDVLPIIRLASKEKLKESGMTKLLVSLLEESKNKSEVVHVFAQYHSELIDKDNAPAVAAALTNILPQLFDNKKGIIDILTTLVSFTPLQYDTVIPTVTKYCTNNDRYIPAGILKLFETIIPFEIGTHVESLITLATYTIMEKFPAYNSALYEQAIITVLLKIQKEEEVLQELAKRKLVFSTIDPAPEYPVSEKVLLLFANYAINHTREEFEQFFPENTVETLFKVLMFHVSDSMIRAKFVEIAIKYCDDETMQYIRNTDSIKKFGLCYLLAKAASDIRKEAYMSNMFQWYFILAERGYLRDTDAILDECTGFITQSLERRTSKKNLYSLMRLVHVLLVPSEIKRFQARVNIRRIVNGLKKDSEIDVLLHINVLSAMCMFSSTRDMIMGHKDAIISEMRQVLKNLRGGSPEFMESVREIMFFMKGNMFEGRLSRVSYQFSDIAVLCQ